jgi:hypothetical protein
MENIESGYTQILIITGTIEGTSRENNICGKKEIWRSTKSKKL